MEEKKDSRSIKFTTDEGAELDLFVVAETKFNGKNYLLVTDNESDMETNAYILKELASDSKEVAYDGSEVSVKIDNENLVSEDVPAVQSIQVTPASVKLLLGQSRTLSVKATLDDGTSQFVTLDVTCETSDPEVAVVRDGIIYAGTKEGTADIDVSYTDGLGKAHHATVAVEASVPTNIYTWKAVEWYRNRVEDRVGTSDIRYSAQDNTVTITRKGAQNIALKYREKKYLEPGMKYFVAVATEVSNVKTDSQLWYINGRWVNIVNPVDVRILKDGRVMIAWSIDENKGYQLTGETIFGMTSTNSNGQSVISYVGFTADLKALEDELNGDATGMTVPHLNPSGTQTIYALDGTPRKQLSQGVNIVVGEDGKSSKIFKK